MGNACGCGGNIEDSEIKIKKPSALDFREVSEDFKYKAGTLEQQQVEKVVKIQAHFRGANARRNMKTGGFVRDKLLNDPSLIFVESHTFPDGTSYRGQMRGNIKHGYGILIWPDGAKYEGMFENNKSCGRGKYYHIDGDIYEGEWDNDMANGNGKYIHSSGAKYEG